MPILTMTDGVTEKSKNWFLLFHFKWRGWLAKPSVRFIHCL